MAAQAIIERPQRWDVPFDENMTEEDVDQILSIKPFSEIDQNKFPKSIPLRGIIANEAKVHRFQRGDIIVRRGDYGNSAFFIMKGAARVVIPTEQNVLPEALLGRKTPERKSLWQSVSQLWKNPEVSEYRAKVQGTKVANDDGGEEETQVRLEGDGARIFLQDVPAIIENHKSVRLESESFFGEIAALGRTPRTATIFADEDESILIEIKWQGLRDLRKYTPALKESIDKAYRERSLNVQLQGTPMFSHLNEEEIQELADQTQFKTVGDFDWHGSYKRLTEKSASQRLDHEPIIYDQGGYPDALVLIRAGFARVSEVNGNGHRTVSYIGIGQTFGFREIAHNWRCEKDDDPVTYQQTLRGLGYVDILIIPSSALEKLVLPKMKKEDLPPMIKPKNQEAEKKFDEKVRKKTGEKMGKTDVMEFMVEHRYINGTATMMVNLDRCTRCDDCVNACASAHDNNPRFVRQGRNMGSLMVAHSCQHCQDPVCLIGCPTGAIHRRSDEGQVTINDTTCIGCATCANSCPYENIRMVEVRNDTGDFIRDDESKKPIIKATKCDLCAEQIGGPSCQNACPHDALVRMDMQNPEKLMEWIGR